MKCGNYLLFLKCSLINVNLIFSPHFQLWQSGFGISKSLASGALNGDRINATMYYMLSQVRAPLHEKATSKEAKVEIQKQLYFPDRCYDGHHTL